MSQTRHIKTYLSFVHRTCVVAVAISILGIEYSYAAIFSVGPSQSFTEVEDVPWETLGAGDEVQIHWRDAPYKSKWVIARSGTLANPIIVRGIKNANGERPVVSGDAAITRTSLNYWNEDRGVIKIGGSSFPSGAGRNIIIESLRIEAGHPNYGFTDDNGNADSYRSNAAAIFIEHGENITIRDCVLTDSGNGLFVANQSENITVEYSHLFGNGNDGSIFEHNAYTEALGMIYQFNRFGPLRPGAGGNNLKDRSASLIVRYNWIEDGNRQLDLVDSSKFAQDSPNEYQATVVYGNILVEHDGEGNRQMVHYGGDSGNSAIYRKGMLYFYHNTLVSERSGRSTLFRLATNDESADIRNNVFFAAGGPNNLELGVTAGIYGFSNNWISAGYVTSFDTGFSGTISHSATISGSDPGFIDRINQKYTPTDTAPLINASTNLAASVAQDYPVSFEYAIHQQSQTRINDGALDLGALELPSTSDTRTVPTLTTATQTLLLSVLVLFGAVALRRV